MKTTNFWQPSTMRDMWSEWLSPLKYYEPSLVLTYPGSDISRRAQQLFEDKEFIKRELGIRKLELKVLDYRVERWGSGDRLKEVLGKKANYIQLVWVFGFEEIMRDKRADLIIELQNYYRDPDYRLVLVCEANYYDEQFEPLILSLPSFEPRISLHGNYSETLLYEFIKYLESKWHIRLSVTDHRRILAETGHNMGLVKSVLWYLRDKGSDRLEEALESHQFLWRVKALWHKLSKNEKEVTLANIYGLKVEENLAMSLEYLDRMGILHLPMLEKYVRKYVGNPRQLYIDEDRLLIGKKDYSAYFTQKQKIILTMLQANSGECISREKIIEKTWENDPENGSDWALDSQINRLRQRLQELGIGKQRVSTKRGKGIVWLSQ